MSCQTSGSPFLPMRCFLRCSIRARSDIPNSFAAPVQEPLRRYASMIFSLSFCGLRSVRLSSASGSDWLKLRSAADITSVFEWKAAYRTVSFSSLTLPGHGCSFNALTAEASSFFSCAVLCCGQNVSGNSLTTARCLRSPPVMAALLCQFAVECRTD